MINWDSYSHRRDVARLQLEINKLARPHDGRIDSAAVARRCRQLRDAYAWEAMKDATKAVKHWMARGAKRLSRHEGARRASC